MDINVARNNWKLEDFQNFHNPTTTRINFCDNYCMCTTIFSRNGIGSTRSRLVSEIDEQFITELNVWNCWITEINYNHHNNHNHHHQQHRIVTLTQ